MEEEDVIMPPRRSRNAEKTESKEHLSRDMRRTKLALFIQQFDKEALERRNHMKAEMENLLATVDRAYEVALMKMPPALRKTRLGDLISADDVSASEVSIALKSETPPPLRRRPSKRTQSTESPLLLLQSSSKTAKERKGTKKAKALASSSMGHLMGSSASVSRSQSCVTRTNNRSTQNQSKPKLRSVVSTGDMHCAMEGSAAHVTVTTGQGQTVSFSEETKNEINWDLLDDVAWYQIQRLTSLMEDLSQRKKDT